MRIPATIVLTAVAGLCMPTRAARQASPHYEPPAIVEAADVAYRCRAWLPALSFSKSRSTRLARFPMFVLCAALHRLPNPRSAPSANGSFDRRRWTASRCRRRFL